MSGSVSEPPPKLIPAIAANPPNPPADLLSVVCGTIMVVAVYSLAENKAMRIPITKKSKVNSKIDLRAPHTLRISCIKSISSSAVPSSAESTTGINLFSPK